MGMGAPAGPIQQTTPATGGKGQPGPGVQQPNRPGPMPAQGGKGLPSGQPMQPQGPYGQRFGDMDKGKDFNRGQDFNRGPNYYGNQGPYGQPYPGFVPGQLPQGLPARPPLQQMDPAMMARLQQLQQLQQPQPQPQPGLLTQDQMLTSPGQSQADAYKAYITAAMNNPQLQGLGQVPANQGLGSIAQTLGYTPYTNAQYAAIQKANPGMAIG